MIILTDKLGDRNKEIKTRIEENSGAVWYGLQRSCYSKNEGKVIYYRFLLCAMPFTFIINH